MFVDAAMLDFSGDNSDLFTHGDAWVMTPHAPTPKIRTEKAGQYLQF
jgi:hypothetical protein